MKLQKVWNFVTPKAHWWLKISKMVPNPNDEAKFIAFGRVLSGIISAGKKVNFLAPNYTIGKNFDLYQKAI